jgi:hypothetical protein
MDRMCPTLLFTAISAYYIYSMDMTHAFVLVYILVASRALPYLRIRLDVFTETCWKIFHLCWLFDHYDSDPAPLFTFFCWEILVVALMMYFGPQPSNDVALFGMLATIHDLFSWVWRAPRMLI